MFIYVEKNSTDNRRFLPLHPVVSFLLLLIGSLLLLHCREKPPTPAQLPLPDNYVWQILGAGAGSASGAEGSAKPVPVGLIARNFPAVKDPFLRGGDGDAKIVLLHPESAEIGQASRDSSLTVTRGSPVNPATLAAIFLVGARGKHLWGMAPDIRVYAVKFPPPNMEISLTLQPILKQFATLGIKVVLLQLDERLLRDSQASLEAQLNYAGLSYRMHFIIPVPEEPSGLFALSAFPEGHNIHYISGLEGPESLPVRSLEAWMGALSPPERMAMGPGKNLTVAPSFSIPGSSALLDSLGWDEKSASPIVAASRFCGLLARLIQFGAQRNGKFSLHDYILALKTSARPLSGVPWYRQGNGIPELKEAARLLDKMTPSTPVFEFRNLTDPGKQGILIDSSQQRQEVEIRGQFWPRNAGRPDTLDLVPLQKGISVQPSWVVANRVSRLSIIVRAESLGSSAPRAGMVVGRYRSNGLRVLEIPLLILPDRARNNAIATKP